MSTLVAIPLLCWAWLVAMAFVLFEKLAPLGAYSARLGALALIGAAAWVLAG